MKKESKKYLVGCPEWTCQDIGKSEIISVYGVMQKCFINMMSITPEASRALLNNYENCDIIATSNEDGEGANEVDFECCEYYIVNLFRDEETTKKILDASGMAYELYFSNGEYIFVKDFYNMSNKGVETNLYYTDDINHKNKVA